LVEMVLCLCEKLVLFIFDFGACSWDDSMR
jgi:hypothetical protein